jgi:hypothetical protein
MSRNITTLRDLLFDAIAGVKSGDLDLDKTLVDTARAEIDHAKITGGMAGDFLDAGTTNRLPAPGHQTQERTAHGIRTTTTTPEGAVVHQHRMRG